MINYDVPVNSHGLNALLRYHVLDSKTMKSNGFNWTKSCWCLSEDLGHEISLSIHVADRLLFINVIDEDFCQPYDYQAILKYHPDNKVALEIHQKVQSIMKKLSDAGIIEGYVPNDYI